MGSGTHGRHELKRYTALAMSTLVPSTLVPDPMVSGAYWGRGWRVMAPVPEMAIQPPRGGVASGSQSGRT
jgi:hypothetical protein